MKLEGRPLDFFRYFNRTHYLVQGLQDPDEVWQGKNIINLSFNLLKGLVIPISRPFSP